MLTCLQELPAPLLDEPVLKTGQSTELTDDMKIAWRYKNLPQVQVCKIIVTQRERERERLMCTQTHTHTERERETNVHTHTHRERLISTCTQTRTQIY